MSLGLMGVSTIEWGGALLVHERQRLLHIALGRRVHLVVGVTVEVAVALDGAGIAALPLLLAPLPLCDRAVRQRLLAVAVLLGLGLLPKEEQAQRVLRGVQGKQRRAVLPERSDQLRSASRDRRLIHVSGKARLVGRAGADLEGDKRLDVDEPQVRRVRVRPHLVDELCHRPGVRGAPDAVDAGVERLEAGLLLEVGRLVAHRARAAEDDEVRRLLELFDLVDLDGAV